MRPHFPFIVQEAIIGVRRNAFHSFVALAASALAITVLGFFFYGGLNLKRAADNILSRFQIEAFIALAVPPADHPELKRRVQQLDERWEINYVSRQQAAAQFAREFDPELFDVLKVNPLPASFRITLPPAELQPDSVADVINRLLSVEGIDDVVYDRELLELLYAGLVKITRWGLLAGGCAVLLAVGLTYNALRLKIDAQSEAIKLLSLLGTTPASLRAIFWVQGAVLGTLGGALSMSFLLGVSALLRVRFAGTFAPDMPFPYLPLAGGCLLGILSAVLAVGRYLKV